MLNKLLLICFFSSCCTCFAQQIDNPYNIKKAKGFFGRNKCKEYQVTLKKMPKDVRFDVVVEGGEIYILCPSLEHFRNLFDKNRDGIALDVIHKDQYVCGEEFRKNFQLNKGSLLAPMYRKEMEENMFLDQMNDVVIHYGKLPEQFDPSEVELNLLALQKKSLCGYYLTTNIDYGNWDLLEMGLYWDSIPETGKDLVKESYTKSLSFTIPFEKNSALFAPEDMKPLYDSLALSDYKIAEISIEAFSSVEGPGPQNEILQEQRAQSIIRALQAFQQEEIKKHVQVQENWKQFAEDISGTPFEYLRGYTKEQIKQALAEDEELLEQLEPILARQRKATIELKLQNNQGGDTSPEKIKQFFHASLTQQDMEEAIFLQHAIFQKIRNEELPDHFIDQLEIPRESAFGPLFNNLVLFQYEREREDLYETIEEIERLQTFLPDNEKLKYNLAALKIRAWAETTSPEINKDAIERLINELKNTEIHPSLVNRLKLNQDLLLIQYLTYEKKFREKGKLVWNVYLQYKAADLDDYELLRLAKFLAFYSEFETATEVLYPRIGEEGVSEDLLFYYLTLTMGNSKTTGTSEYKKVLNKVAAINNVRFCQLFLPKSQGGVTFQLKDNPVLDEAFCRSCQ